MIKTDTKEKYIETIGRRKTAIARVRLSVSTKSGFEVNGKNLDDYFKTSEERLVVMSPLGLLDKTKKFRITAVIKGGGVMSQAVALRHGVSRAIVAHDAETRKGLKEKGFLKRDQRAKERRKFGLKKARKAPQWSKR